MPELGPEREREWERWGVRNSRDDEGRRALRLQERVHRRPVREREEERLPSPLR